jgi:mutator protein MutT
MQAAARWGNSDRMATVPTTPAILVVAALIVRDGRLLVCQRRADDVFPLKWEFPGGKVHAGETHAQALQRELQEELGVTAAIGEEIHRTRHHYPQMASGIELRFFRVSLPLGVEPRNLTFAQMEWVAPTEMTAYDFLAADRELVALLANASIRL